MRTTAKPDVKLDAFKRNLRRELLSAERSTPVRPRLTATGAAIFALTAMLVLFVVNPGLPAGLNAMLTGASPDETATLELDALANQLDEQKLQALLQDRFAPAEADREFVRAWHEQTFPSEPMRVRSLRNEGIFAVREFLLDNGKQIKVYTQLSGEGQSWKASY